MLNKLSQQLNCFFEGGERKLIPLEYSAEEGNGLIYSLLSSGNPCMIARFGSLELDGIIRCQARSKQTSYGYSALLKLVGKSTFDERVIEYMRINTGFFPSNPSTIRRFVELMIASMPNLDILGSWVAGENLFQNNFKSASLVPLRSIEPYYHKQPWTRALEGKKVLVIHPFAKTIAEQYTKRELLFEDKSVLPFFELKTLKSVQSIAGQEVPFVDWFQALEHMKEQIKDIDFDVAIIGCGAYGFPLAAYVKSLGRQAVHMGGATQILFGIKGKRWDDHSIISKLYNDHWVRPSESEIPKDASRIEDGCYW